MVVQYRLKVRVSEGIPSVVRKIVQDPMVKRHNCSPNHQLRGLKQTMDHACSNNEVSRSQEAI